MDSTINRTVINDTEFRSIGEVLVATDGIFAIKCKSCKNTTYRWQTFMRHVHQFHGNEIKFQTNANFMVYSVEELVSLKDTCEIDESEESGVAEDDLKWSDDEDDIVERQSMAFRSMLDQGIGKGRYANAKNDNYDVEKIKSVTLANMSILNAFEDCDVSLNFVENLDETLVDETKSNEDGQNNQRNGHLLSNEIKENRDHVGEDGNDSFMNSTLLKQIELECDLDEQEHTIPKDENHVGNASIEKNFDQNVSRSEANKEQSSNNVSKSNKCGGLKSLLGGLDDLGNVDDLLESIDDSVVIPNEKNDLISDILEFDGDQRQPKKTSIDTLITKDMIEISKSPKGKSMMALQLMADLDLDDLDIGNCLEGISMVEEKNATTKCKESLPLPKSNTIFDNEILMMSTKRCKTSSGNQVNDGMVKKRKLGETRTFEEAINEDNTSTLVYTNMETDLPETDDISNSLEILLTKDLVNEEDLDMLIHQLETSTPCTDDENILNKTFMEETFSENESKKEGYPVNIANLIEMEVSDDMRKSVSAEDNENMAITGTLLGPMSINKETTKHGANVNEKEQEHFIDPQQDNTNERMEEETEIPTVFDHLVDGVSTHNEARNQRANENDIRESANKEEQHQKCLEEKVENTKMKMEQENEIPTDEESHKGHKSSETDEDFENLLNDDLSNALKMALGEEDIGLLKREVENPKGNYFTTDIQHIEIEVSPKQKNKTKNSRKVKKLSPQKSNEEEKSTINRRPALLKETKNIQCPGEKLSRHKFNDSPKRQLSSLKPREQKENVSLDLKTPSSRKEQHKTPQKSLSKIKKEKLTPARCFIETNRGDRTPLKVEELFLKQSPKIQEKFDKKLKPETPADKVKKPVMVFKQSPKTQEKSTGKRQSPRTLEKSWGKRNASNTLTPRTPEEKYSKISPSKCKVDLVKAKLIKTPKKVGATETVAAEKSTVNNVSFVTPHKIRNLSIKLVRCSPFPTGEKNGHKSHDIQTSPKQFKIPETKKKLHDSSSPKKSSLPLQIDNLHVTKNSKMSKDIKLSNLPNIASYPVMAQVGLLENSKSIPPSSIATTKTNSTLVFSRFKERQATIGIPKTRLKGIVKTPLNKVGFLNHKRYTLNRSARKKEVLQRMRHIKKQIFKSIGSDILGQTSALKSPIANKTKKAKIQIENIQILPNVKDEILTPLLNSQNLSPWISPQIAEASPKNSKNTDNILTPTSAPLISSPKLEEISSKTSQPKAIASSSEKATKRLASSSIQEEHHAKKPYSSSSREEQGPMTKTLEEMDSVQLGLSESVMDFLQRDLKANRLNVDSLLNEDMPMDDDSPCESGEESNGNEDNKNAECNIKPKFTPKKEETCVSKGMVKEDRSHTKNSHNVDAPLDQVKKEQNSNDEIVGNIKNIVPKVLHKDYDEKKDLELLQHVGLKIIKFSDIEDIHPLEMVEEMQNKAKEFANICQEFHKVFTSKRTENEEYFQQLLNQTNQKLNVNFKLCDLKRLINMIVMWYTNCYNRKFLEKIPIPEVTMKYLLMFHFVPKTAKRLYYCEFCPKHFSTENRYYNHRIVHTGAVDPFVCSFCFVGFSRINQFKAHVSTCKKLKKEENTKENKRGLRISPKNKSNVEEKNKSTKIRN
ncbi:uncharacterized protein LOC142241690 [Haematobia irritans]|uniref:uncharacterized protein LOC142241690 n=1 Tax=Haematobia irritans TaxID=7368 RepID=UPI003F50CDDD